MTHKFLHIGLTPPPPFTQCVKKTSNLVDDGFPKVQGDLFNCSPPLPLPSFSTKKKTAKQPITAQDLLEQQLWFADLRFSFWY